ncbi:MAG: ATP-binding protein [Campylobacterota bacterium]|nr:ATP-binding protein [Campylobacterota bacterium]
MIGRYREIKQLNEACDSQKSEFIAIYGRRRVGKTYLVEQMFSSQRKDCLYFEFTGAYKLSTKAQIENFTEQVFVWFRATPTVDVDDWMSAFRFLKQTLVAEIQHNSDKKVALFFDEVPWVDKNNSEGFLAALGYFWNTYCQKDKIFTVIICGSNASWIKNKIFDDSEGPLYKRLTSKIPMKPFDLKETKKYLQQEIGMDIDDRLATEVYMCVGGVAKYLSYFDKSKDVYENIDNLFFNVDGMLYDEYHTVFKSLFQQKSGIHKAIMDALSNPSQDRTVLGLVESLKNFSRGPIDSAIDELVLCGFIKGIGRYNHKSKGVNYIVIDPLCDFYNKWVKEKSKNDMLNLSLPYWGAIAEKQEYAVWAGLRFESVCLANIDLFTSARGLRSIVKNVSYWNYADETKSGKGAQIDIIVKYNNDVYDLVECKYVNKPFSIDSHYAKNLLNKKVQFREHGLKGRVRSDIKTVMLTTFGCIKNTGYSTARVAADITLEDILRD